MGYLIEILRFHGMPYLLLLQLLLSIDLSPHFAFVGENGFGAEVNFTAFSVFVSQVYHIH